MITQPGLEYIKLLFHPPDQEDDTYFAPFSYARNIPGLDLPKIEPGPHRPPAKR